MITQGGGESRGGLRKDQSEKESGNGREEALRSEDIAKGVFVPVRNLPKATPKKAARNTAALPMAANQ